MMPAHPKPVPWILLAILLTGSMVLSGCTTTPVTTGTPTTGKTIVIQNFVFTPANLTIDRGTTVTWINKDTVNHQVTSDDPVLAAQGTSFSSPIIAAGETYTVMFGTPGTYTYHCSLHPLMKGTITVT